VADRVNIPLSDRYDRCKEALRGLEDRVRDLEDLMLDTQAVIGFAYQVIHEHNEDAPLPDNLYLQALILETQRQKLLKALGLLKENAER
jgi:hypothetical protein